MRATRSSLMRLPLKRKGATCSLVDGPSVTTTLRRGSRGEPHMPVERIAATDDVEHDRVILRQIVALQDISHVLQRDRFPNMHADENIAAANALLGGGAAGADIEDRQAAAITGIERLELVGVHDRELQTERVPGAVR